MLETIRNIFAVIGVLGVIGVIIVLVMCWVAPDVDEEDMDNEKV